jgi:hypothetical protein
MFKLIQNSKLKQNIFKTWSFVEKNNQIIMKLENEI